MRDYFLYIIIIFLISFIQAQKPENIAIFDIGDYNKNKETYYEFTVSKNEIFGFQFITGRGTAYYWQHLNVSNNIRFLNYSNYFPHLMRRIEEIGFKPIVENPAKNKYDIILGGTEFYYEVFQALEKSDHAKSLRFIYTNGHDLISNVSVDIYICDEIYKDQCINNETMKCVYNKENKNCISNTLCDKVESVSSTSCENAVTPTPSLTKCIYENNEEEPNIQKNCTSKKLCKDSLKEEECNSAITQYPEITKCVFNKEVNKCELKELCELETNPSLG